MTRPAIHSPLDADQPGAAPRPHGGPGPYRLRGALRRHPAQAVRVSRFTILRRRDLAEDNRSGSLRAHLAARFELRSRVRGSAVIWMATIVAATSRSTQRAPASADTDDSALEVILFNGRSALDEIEASDDQRRMRAAINGARSNAAKTRHRSIPARRKPRGIEPALRRASEHDQDLAAPRRARYPGSA